MDEEHDEHDGHEQNINIINGNGQVIVGNVNGNGQVRRR